MLIVVDPSNPVSVRTALNFLPQFLPVDDVAPDTPVEHRLAEYVWSRVGFKMQVLLTKIWHYPGFDYTQEKLATDLGRPHNSVRSSMNAGLRRVLTRATLAIPGAPELLVWKKNAHGIWEFGMSDAMKEAFRRYMEIPEAD
jgi:hypothetical protein